MFCSSTWNNNEQIRYRKAWSNVAITSVVITCVTRVDRVRVGRLVSEGLGERENARWSRESGGGVPATWRRRLDVHWRHHIDHRPTYTSSLSNHRLLLVLQLWNWVNSWNWVHRLLNIPTLFVHLIVLWYHMRPRKCNCLLRSLLHAAGRGWVTR